MTEYVPEGAEPVPDREMSTGIPPADLDDRTLSHHLGSLERSRQDIEQHGSPQAEEHHEARSRELEAEQERRVHGADSRTGGHAGRAEP